MVQGKSRLNTRKVREETEREASKGPTHYPQTSIWRTRMNEHGLILRMKNGGLMGLVFRDFFVYK